mgnify:CR=1 FL=1
MALNVCCHRSPTCGAAKALSALLMALTMFLILYAYYLLKTAREVFILAEGGAEVKSYSSAGQALLLIGPRPVPTAALASTGEPRPAHSMGDAVLRRAISACSCSR